MIPGFGSGLRTAALAVLLLLGASVGAHEGHSHGDDQPVPIANAAPRGEAATAALELVAVLRDGTLTAYLDRFATNAPILGATLTLEGPDGPVDLGARPDGTYTIAAPWLERAGDHDLLFTATLDGQAEIVTLELRVPEPASAGAGAPTGPFRTLSERLVDRDPVTAGVAATAFLLGIAVTLLARRRPVAISAALFAIVVMGGTRGALAHEGEEHGHAATETASRSVTEPARRLPDGTVFVPKPVQRILAVRTIVGAVGPHGRTIELPGRIIPDPNASGVVQSSVGGRLSAPPEGFPRLGARVRKGAVLAYVTPPVQRVDVSDMRQRQGELDQQIATVQRRVERYRKLAPSGAISIVQRDEAEDELRGLTDRRAALDAIRQEPEALVAPVDGIVAETVAVAGQMATPGTVIFGIVDPARLYVEALSYEAIVGTDTATARLADGRSIALAYRGAGLADRNQSVPIHFSVAGDAATLRIGQFVTVQASTGERQDGLAVPRASVTRGPNGQDVVYEHVGAERFVPRPVRTTPLDGDRVLVAAGLAPGTRIVTQGAELLDQVR